MSCRDVTTRKTCKQLIAAAIYLFFLSFISAPVRAETATNLNYIIPSKHGIYKNIIDLNQHKLNMSTNAHYHTYITSLSQKNQPRLQADLIVTIGTKAAQYAYQNHTKQPIISALLTRSAFEKLSNESYGDMDSAIKSGVIPLLISQPLHRYIHLGIQLVPTAKTVGILVGPANHESIPSIKNHLTRLGLTPRFAIIDSQQNPIEIITPAIKRSDFFIVLPDQQLINKTAAKWVLQLAYRYKKPIIAYSKKYVQAGALAAVYSSPQNIAESIYQAIQRGSTSSDSRQPPILFSVAINTSVAHSLGIPLLNMQTYEQQILSTEEAEK